MKSKSTQNNIQKKVMQMTDDVENSLIGLQVNEDQKQEKSSKGIAIPMRHLFND